MRAFIITATVLLWLLGTAASAHQGEERRRLDPKLVPNEGREPRDFVPRGFGRRGRVLHMDAHDPRACAVVAREARESGTVVSLDVDNVYEGIEELLPHVDVLISSKEFPRRMTGEADGRAALAGLKEMLRPDALVGMTLGERGAVVYHEGRFVEAPAFAVPGGCRDTTGAGDAFHTGFLYGLLRGEEVEGCLTLGCAVAALKCRALGARTALPSAPELDNFLHGEGETS